MKYIVIYKDKHYQVNDSSKVGATLQAWGKIQIDFNIDSITSDELTVIEPQEFITKYGEYINFEDYTITYNGITYPLNSATYDKEVHFFLKPICSPKVIYYYNGTRYEVIND